MADETTNDRSDPSREGAPVAQRLPAAATATRSPGLSAIMDAVQFTNREVLDPPAGTIPDMGAKALADQAAAMMIQDMRSYLQSTEMVLIPATAKAIAQILNDEPSGAVALAAIETLMEKLPAYATGIAEAAGNVTKDFE